MRFFAQKLSALVSTGVQVRPFSPGRNHEQKEFSCRYSGDRLLHRSVYAGRLHNIHAEHCKRASGPESCELNGKLEGHGWEIGSAQA